MWSTWEKKQAVLGRSQPSWLTMLLVKPMSVVWMRLLKPHVLGTLSKFVFVGIWRYFFRRLSGLDKAVVSSHPPPRRGRHVTCWLSHHMNVPPHCAPAMKTHKMLSSDSWTIYRLWIPILCKGCSLKLLLHGPSHDGLKLKGSIEQPNQKMAKELNWGEIQMASSSLQSCSIPIAVGEMWIETALPFSHQSQNGCLPVKKWW